MLKQDSRNSNADAPDVTADDPVGTMERFTDGLKRVLGASKPLKTKRKKRLASSS